MPAEPAPRIQQKSCLTSWSNRFDNLFDQLVKRFDQQVKLFDQLVNPVVEQIDPAKPMPS